MSVVASRLSNFRKKLLDLTVRNRMINLSSKAQDNLLVTTIDIQKFLEAALSQKFISVIYPREVKRDVFIEKDLSENGKIESLEESEVSFYALNTKINSLQAPQRNAVYNALSQYSKYNKLDSNLVPKSLFESKKNSFGAIYKNNKIEILGDIASIYTKLNKIRTSSNSHREEMGSETMFLTFGFLNWKESPSNKILLRSPLILIPILLKDIKATNSFEFKYTGDNIVYNRSLSKKLKESFGIELPEYKGEQLEDYFKKIESALSGVVLTFDIEKSVSFSILNYMKQSMYEDLTPEKWNENKKITHHGIVSSFFDQEEVFNNPKPTEEYKDPILIEDADSTQISAINSALNGESFILEGPPGTGKSQTITNMIAALIADGKKILFVTEKNVAIEVVHNKLIKAGLGNLCINMHSSTAPKSNIINTLGKCLSEPNRKSIELAQRNKANLESATYHLNNYAKNINSYHRKTGLTVHQILMISKILKDKLGNNRLRAIEPSIDCVNIDHNYLIQLQVFKKNYRDIIGKIVNNYGTKFFTNNTGWRSIDFSLMNAPEINEIELSIRRINEIITEIISDINNSELKPFLLEISEKDVILISNILNNINPNIAKKYLFSLDRFSNVQDDDSESIKVRLENNLLKLEKTQKDLRLYFIDSINGNGQIEELFRLNEILTKLKFDNYADYVLFSKKLSIIHQNKNALKSIFQNIIENIGSDCSEILPYSTLGILNLIKIIHFYKKLDIRFYPFKNISFSKLEYEYIQKFHAKKESLLTHRKKISKKYRVKKIEAVSIEDINTLIDNFNNEGFFSFLNKNFRKSSALLKEISKTKTQYSKSDLLAVKHYKLMHDKFMSECKQDQSILSSSYDGINTKSHEIISAIKWQNEVKSRIGWNISGDKKLSEFIINSNLEFSTEILDSEDLIELFNNISTVNNYFNKFPINSLDTFLHDNKVPSEISRVNKIIKSLTSAQVTLYSTMDCKSFSALSDLYFDFKECQNIKSQLAGDTFNDVDIFSRDSINHLFSMINEAKSLDTELNKKNLDLKEKVLENISDHNIESLADTLNKITEKCRHIREISYEINSAYGVKFSDWYGGKENLTFVGKLKINEEQLGIKGAPKLLRKLSLLKEKERELGITDLINKIEKEEELLNSDMTYIDHCVYSYLIKDVWSCNEYLNNFSSVEHNNAILNFRTIDIKQKELNINLVKQAALSNKIPEGNNKGRVGSFTERSLIEHHANLQRPNISIRNIFKQAKNAVLALKPCVMMSPLSVGKYLPKEVGMFDVLLMDEASQVRPEDALGSIARAKQVIIVGDRKQMPPTSFFSASSDNDDNDSTKIESAESILDGISNILPSKMLKWHYRSNNESLINFSNQKIYDGELVSFPSPEGKPSGIKYHFVIDGFFDAGVNKNECMAIKERLEQILQENPNETIGIAAMNIKQSIFLDEIINNDQCLYKAIQSHEERTGDSIFIKNLENIQGDERDIILISGTYGKNPTTNRLRQGFGPLTRDGGWRRLNVLITRAKKRIEFFSSIDFKEVKISDKSNESLIKYREYLEYAKTGMMKSKYKSLGEPDSEFEISVIDKLEKAGYKCVSQVGEAGYKIDIGVLNKKEDTFLLGIECDGASYHSSKSARDRDRLRQQVLEGIGWSITRIWSTDWFMDSERCIQDILMLLNEKEILIEAKKNITVDHYLEEKSSEVQEDKFKEYNESTEGELWEIKLIINETLVTQKGGLQGIREKYEEARLDYNRIANSAGYNNISELELALTQEFIDSNNVLLMKDKG